MGLFDREKEPEAEATDDVVDLSNLSIGSIGAPGNCPRCGGAGFLDRIDMRREIQHQHCRACGHAWERTFAELTEAERS